MRTRLLIAALPLVLGLAFLLGCINEPTDVLSRTTPVFPHKPHVVGEDIKCDICHKEAAKGEKAGFPTVKSCMKCHDDIDEKKPPEKKVQAYLKDNKPQWTHVTELPKETKFSHKTHVDAKVECTTCHKGIAVSTGITMKNRIHMAECVACHAKEKVGNDLCNDGCAVCHSYLSKEWKPGNHQDNWRELHGRAAGFVTSSTQRCELCHTQKTCIQCHKNELPKDHTNYWRIRGHGVAADFDRQRCANCHTADSCIRCHKTVTPQSHKGNWASRHCFGCHLPLKDEPQCVACHKGTPAHGLAPRTPQNQIHLRATADQCRDCHFGLKLPHPDNGDNCLFCHKK
ncbi:MAG TPA: cytochrome c3 family protein [Planctomycetota bacterium]|jgi:hypothetical protein